MADDIKKFEGSHEERLLQAILKSSRLKTDFLNLVIKSCNVLKPVLFTNADVVLDLMNQCDKELFQEEPEGSELSAVKISFEKVFNMELIEKLSASGVGDLQDEVKPVVLTIMNYLQSKSVDTCRTDQNDVESTSKSKERLLGRFSLRIYFEVLYTSCLIKIEFKISLHD